MSFLVHIPLVPITGYGRDEDVQRTRDVGFADHLVKPVGPEALRRVLEKIGKSERR